MSKHVTLNNKNHEVESPKSILEAILKEGAQKLLQQAIENEVEEYLQMNRGVYCKDCNRRSSHLQQTFDFLGFTFEILSNVVDRVHEPILN